MVAVTKRSWSELSDQQKRFVVVGAIVQVTLQMLACATCAAGPWTTSAARKPSGRSRHS